MPLPILILLVVGGITAIAVLTRWMGMSRTLRFETKGAIQRAWEREFPHIPVLDVTTSQSGDAGLVRTNCGYGLVWAMGADSTARFLTGATLAPSDAGLAITLPDYSAPRVTLCLTRAETTQWTSMIEGQND